MKSRASIGEILETSKGLIRIESVKSRPEKLKEAINYAKKFFKKDGVSFQEFNFGKKPSLIVTRKGTKNADLFFLIHLDVVEAEKSQFFPAVKKGRLFGRGSGDMKSGGAIAMHAFKETFAKHSIGIIFTTDEEIDGTNGAGRISKLVNPRLVLAAEPTNKGLVVREKGVLWLKIIANGKAAHGARPWRGKNAIEKIMKDLQKMKKMFGKASEKNHWVPTMNIGVISGGDAPNRIPDKACATVDIRYTEGFSIEKFLKGLKHKKISFEVENKSSMLDNDLKNPLILEILEICARNTGRKEFISEDGASDGRFFTERKIPCLIFGPPAKNIHGLEESIAVKDIMPIFKAFREIAEQF